MKHPKRNTMGLMVVGALAGATLALLYAPASGKETRQRIRKTAGKLTGRAKEGLDWAKEEVGQNVDKAKNFKDRFAEAFSSAKEK